MNTARHNPDAHFDDLSTIPRGQKDTARAVRRHHLDRLKAVRSRHLLVASKPGEAPPSAKRIGTHAHTAAICSCRLCGNPRKHRGGRTIPELRVMQRERDVGVDV
jgi:hypothetical protein